MLVLSRKQGEQIKIGDGITVTILGVRGGVVKVGIDAPPHLRILRGELSQWLNSNPQEDADHPASNNEALAV
jgi:carbon storage regulator